jgi:hypothetical protein
VDEGSVTVAKTPETVLWPAGGDNDEDIPAEGREAGLRKRRTNPKKTQMLKRVMNWVRLIILLERRVRYEVGE